MNNLDDLVELANKAKKEGRNVLIVEFGNKNTIISTTQDINELASQIGQTIALTVSMIHDSDPAKDAGLSEKQVFDALMFTSFSLAEKIIGAHPRESI